MDAIVLCGGLATRLREITEDRIPKILVPVKGLPFIEYIINELYGMGVRNIYLSAGFKSRVLEDYIYGERQFREDVLPWVNLYVIPELEPLGTGGGILNVLHKYGVIHRISEPYIITNGDTLLSLSNEDDYDNYEHLYYSEGAPELLLVGCRRDNDGSHDNIDLHPDGDVLGFNREEGNHLVNCGMYIVSRALFYNETVVRPCHLEKDLITPLCEKGIFSSCYEISKDNFLEIGSPEALKQAEKKIRR